MDLVGTTTLRISPCVQQGGTQTMQQAIYLTHDNPCGANRLIFQTMGLTQIRYIDLKNYLDETLRDPEVMSFFEKVKHAATTFLNNPKDEQAFLRYLNALSLWAQSCFYNLPLPVNNFPGYRFRFTTYDATGAGIFDSYFPLLTITTEISPGIYDYKYVPLFLNPYRLSKTLVYKLCNTRYILPYINTKTPEGADTIYSMFLFNQTLTPETTMVTASLLVDTANARAFGIPRYGFSARSNQSYFSGIGYHCAHLVDIYSIPTDEGGNSTLVDSVFVRLSLEENTFLVGSSTSPGS